MIRRKSHSDRFFGPLVALIVLFALASASPAVAAEPTLKITSHIPEHVTPGKPMDMYFAAVNHGAQLISGNLTVKYTFPDGVVPVEPEAFYGPPLVCSTVGQVVECGATVSIYPGRQVRYQTNTLVESNASGALPGRIELSGTALSGTVTEPFILDTAPIGPFSIKSLDVITTGAPAFLSTQAGSAPGEFSTAVSLPSEAEANLDLPSAVVVAPSESFSDVVAHLPAGFVGNPTATPSRCTATELATPIKETSTPTCPADSQVGVIEINGGDIVSLYNLDPPVGSPAAFGFYYQTIPITLVAKVRPSDDGIDIVALKTSSSVPITSFTVIAWGVPGDSSHDYFRGRCERLEPGVDPEGDCTPGFVRAAFLRTPTSCPGTPLPWGLELDTYQHPGVFVGKEDTTPAVEGCEKLPFDPTLALTPANPSAHAPTGLDVNLTVPQNTDPDGLAEADLKQASVTLPEGVGVNPASADGLQACSDAQLGLGQQGPAACPEASKLGSVEVTTPLLDHPIGGTVYLRSQASNDPESGDLYRLAIELRSDRDGIAIKLPGSLVANKDTGRLTATFANLPQLPFETMQLHFKTGPRAPLATPSACGDYATHAELTSWSGKTVQVDTPFTVDKSCAAAAFAPGFEAGVADATAGTYSPFSLRVTRSEDQPNISRIEATLPLGELAKLAGVGRCPEAGAATGDCPASSLVGTTTVGAGVGPNPLYLPQPGKSPTAVYFAGPYKGAQYSVIVKVPAQAGPFDLGNVAVRSAVRIDPVTTQVSVTSDPLPQVIGGVPVSYRDIRVNIDRPGYTLNPTSCEPQAATGTIGSVQGQSADVSDRFQATDCARLGFRPKLELALSGGTSRGDHPALRATLTMPKGDANIAHASVALPHSEFLAQNHIKTICTRVQFAAGGGGGEKCPKGSVYGHATAYSPLLGYRLSGPVYLRSSDNPLPDLVAALDGEIHVDVVGRIDSKNGGIRSTFATVPDAPVSKFILSMQGGKKGLLENSTNLCALPKKASAKLDGHNGKISDFHPVMKADCRKGGKRGKGKKPEPGAYRAAAR